MNKHHQPGDTSQESCKDRRMTPTQEEVLQRSHDALAARLTEIVDQLCRGSHGPTRMQLLEAARALGDAAPHVKEPARSRYAAAMLGIVKVRIGESPSAAPEPLTAETITDQDILTLMVEANALQDWLQAALCERSLPVLAAREPGARFFKDLPDDKIRWLLSLPLGESRQLCADAINKSRSR